MRFCLDLESELDSSNPSALQTLLPELVPVHHLGLFREPTSLQPVEYYNNLPYHRPTSLTPDPFPIPAIAILLDPVIATGGTSSAAIQTLLEWGVKKVVVISVLGSEEGVRRAAEENGSESVEIWVGGVDRKRDCIDGIDTAVGIHSGPRIANSSHQR